MRKKLLNGLMLALTALALANCGKSDNGGGNGSPGPTAVTPLSCAAGQVMHPTYGCLPTSGCPAGNYGMYQNQCVFIGANPGGQSCSTGSVYSVAYGCVPQGSCGAGQGYYNNTCIWVGQQQYTGTVNCQGMCAPGQVQTPYGCLPAATSCNGFPVNSCMGQMQGPWGNSCIQGYMTVNGYYGFPNYYNGGVYMQWAPRPAGQGWGGWGQGGWGVGFGVGVYGGWGGGQHRYY